MSERIEAHKQKLAESRKYLNEILDKVGDRWDEQIYSDGAQWTIHQLLIHLAVSDMGQNRTVMSIAQGKELIPEDYDLQRYNKRSVEKQASMSVEQARGSMILSRKDFLTWLDSIDDNTLEMKGRHASLQILSVSQILDIMAQHERGHADDIAQHLDHASAS